MLKGVLYKGVWECELGSLLNRTSGWLLWTRQWTSAFN